MCGFFYLGARNGRVYFFFRARLFEKGAEQVKQYPNMEQDINNTARQDRVFAKRAEQQYDRIHDHQDSGNDQAGAVTLSKKGKYGICRQQDNAQRDSKSHKESGFRKGAQHRAENDGKIRDGGRKKKLEIGIKEYQYTVDYRQDDQEKQGSARGL